MGKPRCSDGRFCRQTLPVNSPVEDVAATRPKSAAESPERILPPERISAVDETPQARRRRERQLLKAHLLAAACRQLDVRHPAGVSNESGAHAVDAKRVARFEQVRNEIRAHGMWLAEQGTLVASWKTHQGKRLGPYYRLAYRVDGKQKSIYLGSSEWLVAQVRELLASLQAVLREHRTMERLKLEARQTLLENKRNLADLLHATMNATLKGWEFRRVASSLRQRTARYQQDAYNRRAAEARRTIRGEQAATNGLESRPSEDARV